MIVHFIHLGDAYLPELAAYQTFLQQMGHAGRVHRTLSEVPSQAEVLWWMCGRVPLEAQRQFAQAFQVHEYASASVPPWALLKDRIKRARQPRPQYRIFQNCWVQQRMGFHDAVPSELRDMGLAESFLSLPPQEKTAPSFDAVYLGDMQRLRHFLPLLSAMDEAGQRLLLIGELPARLRQTSKALGRATVTGKRPHSEIPMLLRQARYGLNLVPDMLPYSQQTSTKLLEYCAVGLPVLTTDYAWVRQFEQAHHAKFAYLPSKTRASQDYLHFFQNGLDTRQCQVPEIQSLAWPKLLATLEIWKTLGIRP
jgi:hypothetical protein